MNKNKYLGIWFFGLSKSGKTFSSKYLKKKIKNSILVDGDVVRKKISFDLGYKVSDRKIQLERLLGISEISIQSNCFPIVSSVYLDPKIFLKIKMNKIKVFNVIAPKEKINKKIFNRKNVVGKTIKQPKLSSEVFVNNFKKKIKIKW